MDSTISIDKVSYDVRMQFIEQTVEVRFRPGELDSAAIYYDREHFPIFVL